MVAHRISTLAEVARIAVQEGGLSLPLRDFLDGFQSQPASWKLAEEPQRISPVLKDNGFADAYLAALSDHLCRRHQLPRPDWIFAKDRTLRFPHFAAKTHALRMILLQESPPAFRQRSLAMLKPRSMSLDEITRKALALPPSERRQLIGILLESGIEAESRRKSAAELKSILTGLRSLPGEPMSDSEIQSGIHLARAKRQRGES